MAEEESRTERLLDEFKRLETLKTESTLFDFEASGDPPTRYEVSFSGKGITRPTSNSVKVEDVKLHKCEIRLPFAYPERPPDIRWLTPISHPNISYSGMVKLKDVGLAWEEDLTLDLICERLWDMARLAYYDEDHATNYAAKNWLADQVDIDLPVDSRPLRDKSLTISSNVVKYERRTAKGQRVLPRGAKGSGDVFFIGDETKSPPPSSQPPAPPSAVPRKRPSSGDDVIYIGYE
jgi:ubiquitin-protein ligase